LEAAPQDLLTRVREHLHEYVSKLPDYTCRVTIERSSRRSAHGPFDLTDRLRLEVAYAGGAELYAWPGSAAFERSIDELLPAHGMVSEGSYARHMRTLFLRNVARFGDLRSAPGRVAIDFNVPAVVSGYALTTPSGSAPAALEGTLTLDAATLDLQRLEVRVDTRLAQTVETVTYTRAEIGGTGFVVPETSVLLLTDGPVQLRNSSRYDNYHRFAGSATLSFDSAEPRKPEPAPRAEAPLPAGAFVASLDQPIGSDAAIGDLFSATAENGSRAAGRITDMRRAGKENWTLALTLDRRTIRKTVKLPLPAGWKTKWPPINSDERR